MKKKRKRQKQAYAFLLPGTGEIIAVYTNKKRAKTLLKKAEDYVSGTRDLILQEFPLNPTQESLLRWI